MPYPESLRTEIAAAINRHSVESNSNTPDFILAEYLTGCLSAFDQAVTARERWYGNPGPELPLTPDIPAVMECRCTQQQRDTYRTTTGHAPGCPINALLTSAEPWPPEKWERCAYRTAVSLRRCVLKAGHEGNHEIEVAAAPEFERCQAATQFGRCVRQAGHERSHGI